MIDVEMDAQIPVDEDGLVARARWVLGRLGITRASVGISVVGPERMAEINGEFRDKLEPTDVLAFPIDGDDGAEVVAAWPTNGPPPELGDIVICPDAAEEPLPTLVVHGLLHLLGHDHEIDRGEMLALQDELVAAAP